ncbi:MAG: hypothetical protein RR246_01425 [Clostridia bacterium]
MKQKLKSKRGETLVEALSAILIIALSAAAMATLITTATKVTQKSREILSSTYADFNTAEEQNGDGIPGKVKIGGDKIFDVTVKYYGDESTGFVSYKIGAQP